MAFAEVKTTRGSISVQRASLRILTKLQHGAKLTGNYSLLGVIDYVSIGSGQDEIKLEKSQTILFL